MSYIQEPYFAVKAWELITQRDLEVIDEKADFLDYTKNEILLAALCVAEVVELVARALFSFVIVPYYFITGNSFEPFRTTIIYTALTIGMTGKALYYNIFSKFAFINSIGSASQLIGMDNLAENDTLVEYFNDIEKHRDNIVRLLSNMTTYSKWYSGFPMPKAEEQATQ